MKRILIGGYYGYGNIGDEAILEAFALNLAPYRDIDIHVLSGRTLEGVHNRAYRTGWRNGWGW